MDKTSFFITDESIQDYTRMWDAAIPIFFAEVEARRERQKMFVRNLKKCCRVKGGTLEIDLNEVE